MIDTTKDEKLVMQISIILRRSKDGVLMVSSFDKVAKPLPPNWIQDIINIITESIRRFPLDHPEVMGPKTPIQFNTQNTTMSVAS